jgi:Fic family protein
MEEARFVPISADKLPDGMSDWEKFIHTESPDRLAQLALLHAEFEALHPFMDGNGRMGRMFVPLFLFKTGLLSRPTFYISAFFERNREEYYERLLAVSRDGAWTPWCAFFLKALQSQAEDNQRKAQAILSLYQNRKNWIAELTRSQYAIHALDFLFRRPVFESSEFTGQKGIPAPTAHRILKLLRDKGMFKILQESSGRRPAVLAFRELLNIVEGRDAF